MVKIIKMYFQIKGYKWLHSFGGNYRLTEFQSALGRIQLKKIKNWNNKNYNSKIILNELKKYKDVLIPNLKDYTHAWYRCCVSINKQFLKNGLGIKLLMNLG